MITWVAVSERVPDTRREVWVWGLRGTSFHGIEAGWEQLPGVFGGVSRCNVGPSGHKFDIERRGFLALRPRFLVTHWAEVRGPWEPCDG